ncbi:MAG: hypothetical protein KJ964_08590 [Verrucomicrobia bacterium]|nr:hypothetical protein [Verrucomicrobiota bacterium]MBU1733761.1 hypothetical protein [Verrucomicrobiota bacterium]MBU1857846.1 hypothetical protein [Verrucomicrobiota bacterium]
MKKACYRAIMTGAILLAMAPVLLAATTGQINYQARLLDAYGRRINATVSLAFKLYDAATDGNLLWSETHDGVVVSDGIYSINMGSTTPIPASVFTQDGIYLELAINNETMAPRQLITSAGQALVARTVMGEDIFVNQSNGKVGIGTITPTEQLDVDGTIKITGFKLPTGATANYVLMSDGNGTGQWRPVTAGLTETDPVFNAWSVSTYAPATSDLWTAVGNLNVATDALDTAVGLLNDATNALQVQAKALQDATNALNSNKLNISGGEMTGPLTNEIAYYGNGIGLTNIPASGLILTNYVKISGDTMTGPLVVSNNVTVDNALIVNGSFTNKSTTTYTPGTEQVLANGGSVGVTSITYVKIKGDAAPVTLGDPQVVLGAAGQFITLQGNDNVNTVTFTNSAGLILAGAVPFTMGSNDIMQLVCDGNTWVEMYRCDK